MSNYYIPNAPMSISMEQFAAISGSYGGPGKACKFLAIIQPVGPLVQAINQNGITNDLMLLCETAEFPGRTLEAIEVRYYGHTFELPAKTGKYDAINLTFLTRMASAERQFFDDWMDVMNPISTYDMNYRDDYRANIMIYNLSDVAGYPATYAFTLINAFPLQISPQSVTWADDQVLRLGISFSYQFWYRPGQY